MLTSKVAWRRQRTHPTSADWGFCYRLLGREPDVALKRDGEDRGVTVGMVPVQGFGPLRNPVHTIGFDFSGEVRLVS